MTYKFIDPEWALSAAELTFLKNYRGKHKLQCALFLKFFQKHAYFPICTDDVALHAVRSITDQLNCAHSLHDLDFDDRTARRQKQNIREFLKFRLPVREDYAVLQDWLALGTNTGLKRVLAGGGSQFTYPELRHVRERYIHKDALKAAIAKVVNATLQIRHANIWGEGTMGCASDSKKIHAWDQNLMSEWHVRYRGRGVMVYWHVEKNSLCIYSQLKRCSSSEVGAMIEGVLRHCTDMEIEKQYVDSHGQSEVAFAFCELLGFSLMPRLKAIATQKLYLPEAGMVGRYGNLTPVLNRPINWDLIANQYDQIVKYTAALQKGTADADPILKRFTRNNRQHPTYQALAELGRAIKTIFLCEYLESEEIRREIHEALNVVENCNSTVKFIFFARNSELSSNQLANQEISILALHLLQVCLVYVNTLMIQDVLNEEKWIKQMQKEDFRALTPLIYQHVTPYGAFDLDMKKRIFSDSSDLKIAA